jgi:hypothetical protein
MAEIEARCAPAQDSGRRTQAQDAGAANGGPRGRPCAAPIRIPIAIRPTPLIAPNTAEYRRVAPSTDRYGPVIWRDGFRLR